MAYATPDELIADQNAASLLAEKKRKERIMVDLFLAALQYELTGQF